MGTPNAGAISSYLLLIVGGPLICQKNNPAFCLSFTKKLIKIGHTGKD